MNKSRTKTPTKDSYHPNESPSQMHQNAVKLLRQITSQQISKWMIENKMTSIATKNTKCLNIINMSNHIFGVMLTENEPRQQFMCRLVDQHKGNNKKLYEFCRLLKYFSQKDYQFQYIQKVAKGDPGQQIPFYLKCRTNIIDSFLNKAKKQLMINVQGDQQQWFKIVRKLFKNVRQQQIIQLYTDTIKYHYLNIKKNPHQQLNGAEIFRICQIMSKNIRNQQSLQQYNLDQPTNSRFLSPRNGQSYYNQNGDYMQRSPRNKQGQVKRLFQKNIVDGLQSEDKQLIRILSYKDNNIAKLLEQKHEKMISLIVDDVETMRRSIQEEKKKYVELWNEKEHILKTVQALNILTLNYVGHDSVENEQKLLKAIQIYNLKYKKNNQIGQQIKRLKQLKKNRRLIQIIEREQRQKE